MNAYPPELVVHLQPCVHVSGLVPENKAWHDVLPHPTQVYAELCDSIAKQLSQCSSVQQAWVSPGSSYRFRAVFVDYGHRIPPARMRAGLKLENEAARQVVSALPPRSPLSPLYPSGPLFPDGIISPSWIRKHTEYVPGVHLSFFCMPPHDAASLTMDAALIEVISALRASLAPRGIKLMVVLLCDPIMFAQGIDARVAHLRRASGLDARGALFVLSSGAKSELSSFVTSLVKASEVLTSDYYREHARHVRRNRARYPPPPSVAQPILQAAMKAGLCSAQSTMLNAAGWHIRTHYKLGALAELQGDMAESHSMYAEAYKTLMQQYLPYPTVVLPRTRRWAEAKVLADTLSFKLIKLFLYDVKKVAARVQFRQHNLHITRLCTRWGITDQTHEYWAWLAKQYTFMADLVDEKKLVPARHGFDVPLVRYQAAVCQMERARCTTRLDSSSREGRVDHTALIVPELDRAYKVLFQQRRLRLAHLVAVRLALTLAETQPKRALNYFTRTLQWYRRDPWHELSYALVLEALACAIRCKDVNLITRMEHECRIPVPPCLVSKRTHMLKDVPSDSSWWSAHSNSSANIQLGTEVGSQTIYARAAFARSLATAPVADMPCQVVICLPFDSPVDELHPLSVQVYLAGQDAPTAEKLVSVAQAEADSGNSNVRALDLGEQKTTMCVDAGHSNFPHQAASSVACFSLRRAQPLIVNLRFSTDVPGMYEVHRVECVFMEHGQNVHLLCDIDRRSPSVWTLPNGSCIPLPATQKPHTLRVRAPTYDVHVPPIMACGQVAPLSLISPNDAILPPGVRLSVSPYKGDNDAAIIDVCGNAHAELELTSAASGGDVVEDGHESGWDGLHASTSGRPKTHDSSRTTSASTSAPSPLWLRAPQEPCAAMEVLLQPTGASWRTERIHRVVKVVPSFLCKAQIRWGGAAQQDGVLLLNMTYEGPLTVQVERVYVETTPSLGVSVDPILGYTPNETWYTGDRAAWAARLCAQAPQGTGAANLVITWRSIGEPNSPEHVTRRPLPELGSPALQHVDVRVSAPSCSMLAAALPVQVSFINTSDEHIADVQFTIESTPDWIVSGMMRHSVSMLLPCEERLVSLELWPQRAGIRKLPNMNATQIQANNSALSLHVHKVPNDIEITPR